MNFTEKVLVILLDLCIMGLWYINRCRIMALKDEVKRLRRRLS